MKGISPLIATVILIALTMAIAGIMAAFATQITSSKVADSQAKADCLGTIDLSSINFGNTEMIKNIIVIAKEKTFPLAHFIKPNYLKDNPNNMSY